MNIQQQLYILKSLEQNPQTTQRVLAKKSGFSLGKVNYCINALIDKGLIKVDNFINNDNKLQYIYLLTPKGINEKTRLTKAFLELKIKEYSAIEQEIAELKKEIL